MENTLIRSLNTLRIKTSQVLHDNVVFFLCDLGSHAHQKVIYILADFYIRILQIKHKTQQNIRLHLPQTELPRLHCNTGKCLFYT